MRKRTESAQALRPPRPLRRGGKPAVSWHEPSLQEMLEEPMVKLLMRRDRVSEADILKALDGARLPNRQG